jgi:hypothetical protein
MIDCNKRGEREPALSGVERTPAGKPARRECSTLTPSFQLGTGALALLVLAILSP